MLLIADSGSTKTDWCFIDSLRNRHYFQTIGINPYNLTRERIQKEIENNILPNVSQRQDVDIFFYGAGCSAPEKREDLVSVFSLFFNRERIHIEHDLLGAARAGCRRDKGIVGILGTGSNSCLYDGKKIVENVPALGYILCDEGAGTNIGKTILRDYLRHRMPEYICHEFSKLYPGSESDFLTPLYSGENPNRYIASFARFAIERQENIYCRRVIADAFHSFFLSQITQYTDYKKYKINIIGSIGYYAQNIFKETANQYGVNAGLFVKAPLDDLIKYHLIN
ncbi:MAG: ATPase [Bacteroidales bacterium]|nr:ATPase [Bacteroidales bacterium]